MVQMEKSFGKYIQLTIKDWEFTIILGVMGIHSMQSQSLKR